MHTKEGQSAQTGKERILLAMDGGKPEQLPIAPMIDWTFALRSAGCDPFDWAYRSFDYNMQLFADAHRRFDSDFTQAWDDRRKYSPERMHIEDGQRYVVDWETGERKLLPDPGNPPWEHILNNPAWQKDLPVPIFDYSGDGSQNTNKFVKNLIKRFVRSVDEVESNMQPLQTAEEFTADGGTDAVRFLAETLGNECFVSAGYLGLAPDMRVALGGETNAFIALAREPKLVEAVLDHLLASYAEQIKAFAQAGADGVRMRAYYEGADMISPKMWRKYFYPRHKAFADICHQNGVRAVMWFLGDCLPLVEDIAEAGIDLLYIEQDRRGYNSDPAEFRKRIGTDLCITGWTYEWDMIKNNREALRKTIQHQIETAGKDGAFIFGSTFISADVAPDTVVFMAEEVRRTWQDVQGVL